MEQQCATDLGERQIAELIEDDEIGMDEPIGDVAGLAVLVTFDSR